MMRSIEEEDNKEDDPNDLFGKGPGERDGEPKLNMAELKE